MPGFSDRPKLADRLKGRDNNLNLIRMIAAAAVLVSHAFPIALGDGAEEPLSRLTGMTLGAHAVMVFFILSGLLIARSFDRGGTLARFVLARAMRLFPALIVVLVLTIGLGAIFTKLPLADFFAAPQTLSYVPRNLTLAFLQPELPGVFEANPYPRSINGSLWTLFYEVVCYGSVVVIGLLGLLRARFLFTLTFMPVAAAFVFSTIWSPAGGLAYRLDLLATLGFPFALGMLAYVWRAALVLDLRIAALLWLLVLATAGSIVFAPAIVLAIGYSAIWLGFVPGGGGGCSRTTGWAIIPTGSTSTRSRFSNRWHT